MELQGADQKNSAGVAPPAPGVGRTFLGHPVGLTVLFLTETWANFSYFGMQALLVYYMIKHLKYAQPTASALYGAYAAYAYLTPLLGGWVADRWLGQKRSVILGGSLMALGHFALAFDGLFFPGLVLVGLGNGFFITSTTTQVGHLYAAGDSRRDRAYTLYYVGINIGGFVAPLVCGTLGEVWGWHYGFAAAGVGMVIGLVIYLCFQGALGAAPGIRRERIDKSRRAPIGPEGRRALRTLFAVAGLVVLFRIAYEQTGNTIALWADAYTDRALANGFVIPATWFQSVNPFLIFALTPFLALWWSRQARRGREPPTLRKMAIGCGLGGLAFIVMIGAAAQYAKSGSASWLWLIGFFFLLTAGELFVLPIGLSLFSRLAPPRAASAMIGVWYLAKFAGASLSGWLGAFWSQTPPMLFFGVGAASAFAASIALFATGRFLLKPAGQTGSSSASSLAETA
ncbi:MAG: peptide MFS transporter [Caulobacteraceae bacterium]